MATTYGRQAASALAATTLTEVYECDASKHATLTISMCNRGSSSHTVRLAMVDSATGVASIANEDYIEYDSTVPANGTLERSGVVVAAGHTIVAYCSDANCSIMCWGFEEDD